MHAYLLVGTNNFQQAIDTLAKKFKTKIFDYKIQKISDVRNLNNLIRLSFDQPTLIVSENIYEATEEALNAFLKNLEEPQENIYFALTAPSTRHVLPTIVSRCQVIKCTNNPITQSTNKEIERFLNMTTGEKLTYIDKIRDREKAVKLAENSVQFLHSKLHENEVSRAWPSADEMVKYDIVAKNIEIADKTLSRLKANGNVNLQLTNFVIKYA